MTESFYRCPNGDCPSHETRHPEAAADALKRTCPVCQTALKLDSPEAVSVSEHLHPGRFEVLLTDIVMPEFDGMQVLREVVEKRAFARLVTEICVLLDKSDDPDARDASRLLADLSHICLASSLDTFEFLNLKWQGLQSWYKEGRASKVEPEKAGEDQKQIQQRGATKKKKSQRRLTLV